MNLSTKLRMMAKGCACNGDVIRADALARAASDADRLTEENAKLREVLESIVAESEHSWIDLDACIVDAKQLLSQLKDQNNDK